MLTCSEILRKAIRTACLAGLGWALGISFLLWNLSGPQYHLWDLLCFMAPIGFAIFGVGALVIEGYEAWTQSSSFTFAKAHTIKAAEA